MTQQTIPNPPTTDAKAANGSPPPAVAPPAPAAAIVPVAGEDDSSEPTRAMSAFASEAALRQGYRIARAIASSSLVPEAFRGENGIPNVLIAMEMANRIGASVMMIMQNLDVIHGRPSLRSQFLIGTLNASGRFTPLRFRFQGKEGTDEWGCRAVAKDRETKEECIGALITIALAKSEGWHGKNGSKWKTMPEQMLMYRAAAFWTRVYAPELSLGMQTKEEIIDTVGYEVPDIPAAIAPGDTKALEADLLKTEPAPAPEDKPAQ